jgi:hypothetical protein
MAAAQLDINSLIGPSAMGPNYKTATSQGEANALNAQGYQLVPGGTTERADGSGTWTMYQMGPSPTKITNSLLGRYVDMYNAVPGDMASLGASQSREIDENAARMAAAANQSATSRGLTNNSALFSIQRGVELDRARTQVALNDSLKRQALDYQSTYLDKIGDLSLALSQLNQNTQQPGQYVAPEQPMPKLSIGQKIGRAFGIRY